MKRKNEKAIKFRRKNYKKIISKMKFARKKVHKNKKKLRMIFKKKTKKIGFRKMCFFFTTVPSILAPLVHQVSLSPFCLVVFLGSITLLKIEQVPPIIHSPRHLYLEPEL